MVPCCCFSVYNVQIDFSILNRKLDLPKYIFLRHLSIFYILWQFQYLLPLSTEKFSLSALESIHWYNFLQYQCKLKSSSSCYLNYPSYYFCNQDPLLFSFFVCLFCFGDRVFSCLPILILDILLPACFLTPCLCNYITSLHLPLHSYGYYKPGCVRKCWNLPFPLSTARMKVGNCQCHLKIWGSTSLSTSEKLLLMCRSVVCI